MVKPKGILSIWVIFTFFTLFKFKVEFQSKEKLYISLAGKKLVIKSMNMFLGFGMKTTKDYHLYLKWDV